MEAKDRLKQIALEVFGTSDGIRPKFPKTGEKIQEAMEISFKAGEKQGYDKGVIDRLREIDALIARLKTVKQAGIREVVEWRLEPCPHRSHNAKSFKPRCACEKCWQAKLKELGADNELQD